MIALILAAMLHGPRAASIPILGGAAVASDRPGGAMLRLEAAQDDNDDGSKPNSVAIHLVLSRRTMQFRLHGNFTKQNPFVVQIPLILNLHVRASLVIPELAKPEVRE